MGTPITTPRFTMNLERADGTIESVPINLDFLSLDLEDQQRAVRLWDRENPNHLAAALIFVGTGLPDEDFLIVAPTLVHAVEGEGEFQILGDEEVIA